MHMALHGASSGPSPATTSQDHYAGGRGPAGVNSEDVLDLGMDVFDHTCVWWRMQDAMWFVRRAPAGGVICVRAA